MEKTRIILASGSPRRKEFLELLGLDFEIIPAVKDEDMTEKLSISKLSKKLAEQKAQEVFDATDGDRIVIGSDSMVYANKKLFGKPKSQDEGRQMLKTLSNRWHKVITSLCVLVSKNGETRKYLDVEIVSVKFMKLNNQMIDAYLATGEYKDKAGSYAVQGKSSKFIEKIEGNYASVVGLPICKLYKILQQENVMQ